LGRHGEGPGESLWISNFSILPDFYLIVGPAKISFFDKEGNYKKDIKKKGYFSQCLPLGNNYVTREYSHELENEREYSERYSILKYVLLNQKTEKIKELFSGITRKVEIINKKTKKRSIIGPTDCRKCIIYKNHLYIGSSNVKFFFSVFDSSGDHLYDIDKPFPRRKVTDAEKREGKKQFYEHIQNHDWELEYFEYYPAYRDFLVEDDCIYVFLFPEKGKQKILKLDLKGNFKRSVTIPYTNYLEYENIYTISKGVLFFLKENDSTENWELLSMAIFPEEMH